MPHDSVKAEHWRGHVAAWCASGVGQRVYCDQHQLSAHGLPYWASRLKSPATPSGMTLAPLRIHAANPNPGVILLHKNNWRLEFSQPPAADWWARLLGQLS